MNGTIEEQHGRSPFFDLTKIKFIIMIHKNENNVAACNHCDYTIERSSNGTTMFWNHLKYSHPELYQEGS
ncbi:hypothetical protein SNEBB_005860, partial [Seison nebaliae]